MKFAKLFNFGDEQVLAQLGTDDNGDTTLTVTTFIDGVYVAGKATYDIPEKAQAAFDGINKKKTEIWLGIEKEALANAGVTST